MHLFFGRLVRAWTSKTDGERLLLTSPERLARLFLWQEHLLMRPTPWNLTSVILLSVLHFDPADCYLQHVEMQRNQITHHYNHSGHNLYNIYILYIYISICEPTVSCFTWWIRQCHSAIRLSFYVLCVTKWTGWVNLQWLRRYPWASAIGFDSNQYSARWNNMFALISRSL